MFQRATLFGALSHTRCGDWSASGHDADTLPKGVQAQCIRLSSGKELRLTMA